jgi:PAS domain S-box-containing protein
MKFHNHLRFVLSFLFLLVICFVVLIYQNKQQVNDTASAIEHNQRIMEELEDLSSFISITEHSKGKEFDKELKKALQELKDLMEESPSERDELVILSRLLLKDVPSVDSARLLFARIKENEKRLLQSQIAENRDAGNSALYLTFAAGLLAIAVVSLAILQIRKDHLQRRAEEAETRRKEVKCQQMIDRSGVVLFTCDATGKFTFVSSNAKELTGYEADELVGQLYSFLVEDAWHAPLFTLYHQQQMERIPVTFVQFPIITKEIEYKWVEQSATLLFDGGRPIGLQCLVKDITEKKKAEEKLKASDEKIRAMLSSTEEGIYMLDEQLNILLFNDAAKKIIHQISGLDVELGRNINDYTSERNKALINQMFEQTLQGGTGESELQLKTPTGKRWYMVHYFPLKNDEGEVIGICVSLKDITERRATEKALEKIQKEREEYQYRLQSILDNTPLIVYVKDLEGRYLFINKSFKETFHLTKEQVLGKTDFDFDTQLNAEKYRDEDEYVIQTLQNMESEEAIKSGDGFRIVHVFKCPLFDQNGTIYGIGGIATDITEKTEYQEKLIAAKLKAEAAEQLQEQFLANMSHEIRTPMNGIIGMANILQETPLNNEQQEFVQIIRQSSDNLLMLINNILDLSKIKAGKLVLEKVDFSLQEELENVLAPFRLKTQEKDLKLSLNCDLPTGLFVSADRLRLHQVLTNLISNAIKFTSAGEVKVEVVSTGISSKEISLQFSVSDTGIGIPADKLAKVFESFVQADSGTTRKFGGTGLGLSITKQLIERQGGKIGLNSEPGVGTRFYFTLTYALSQPTASKAASQLIAAADYTGLAGKKILVVEDNDVNQKVILIYLEKAGIIADIAHNGREAVELLEKGYEYDLLIMDLQMPEMNGFQTAVYIRQKLELKVPIVAMTASALRNERMKCFELGMNEYVTKPFVPAELFRHLRRLLLKKGGSSVVENDFSEPTGLYNLSYLYEMEDTEYFCEVLQLFLTTTPVLLEEIKTEAMYENWDSVYQKAHKLKSSVSILQMSDLLELVSRVEQQAKERKELENIPKEVSALLDKFSVIQPLIEAELSEGKEKLKHCV